MNTTAKRAMTLDELAGALRGMPRNAKMLVELPDGTLRPLMLVRPGRSARDHPEYEPDGYSIILCVEDRGPKRWLESAGRCGRSVRHMRDF